MRSEKNKREQPKALRLKLRDGDALRPHLSNSEPQMSSHPEAEEEAADCDPLIEKACALLVDDFKPRPIVSINGKDHAVPSKKAA